MACESSHHYSNVPVLASRTATGLTVASTMTPLQMTERRSRNPKSIWGDENNGDDDDEGKGRVQ
eukprot:2043485-Pyramimonas_sp.AAC.1